MLPILNIFFFVFHSCLILFNLFGWIWKKTRKANLILLILTLCSWFILGIWFGFGYCPSTDWHWQVRTKLNLSIPSDSYLEFLIETFTGLDVNKVWVDIFALLFLTAALVMSIVANLKDWRKKERIWKTRISQ